MSDRYSLEGADRVTVGTSDVTMRIWLHVHEAGDVGLTRDQIAALVTPHINAGYAKRRYRTQLKSRYRKQLESQSRDRHGVILRTRPASITPEWESISVDSARSFIVTKTLQNMTARSSLVRGDDGRYRAGRRPRYRQDTAALDLTGDITRLHMNGAEALRVLEPALRRYHASPNARLTGQEWAALHRLVELYREAIASGFRMAQANESS